MRNWKLFQGDAVEVMNTEIEPGTIDLIVTSPPYNCGIDYDSYDDVRPWKEYFTWCAEWLQSCYRVLKEDGRICINVPVDVKADKRVGNNRRGLYAEFYQLLQCVGYNYHGTIVWAENSIPKLTAWGSWLSASAPYISCSYETIIVAYKGPWKKINPGRSTISKTEFIRGVSGMWTDIAPDAERLGKATFPIKLPMRCIELLSYAGDTVLDPFCGTGTTLKAAVLTGRNSIGIELSPATCAVVQQRMCGNAHDISDLFS